MRTFLVTVRTGDIPNRYIAIAKSASDAWEQAAERFADVPCGITVVAGVR